MNQVKTNTSPKRGKISPKILTLVGFLLLILLAIGVFLWQNMSGSGGVDVTSDKPAKVAADNISLEPYCTDGYYKIPTENTVCSRAPNCGGYGYDELNTQDKMPNPQACMGDGDSGRQEKGCAGYVPLCCYEMARTGDYTKCIGYWERLWCTKSQCDVAVSNGASGSQCGGSCGDCGHAFKSYCGEDKSEIPLSTRLGGSAPPASPTSQAATPTSPPSELTPTSTQTVPTQTLTPTRSQTPSITSTTTPTATQTPTPTLTNTLTPTLSPTLTLTPTITPTRTPTPPSVAMCDRTCGVCGWRDTTGACHESGELPSRGSSASTTGTQSPVSCCYSTCIGNVCKQVSGYGRSSCTAIGQSCTTSVSNFQSSTQSASLNTTTSPQITPIIIYVTATPRFVGQNVAIPTSTVGTSFISVTQTQVGQSPPVSGGMGWLMLLVIPVVVIGVAIIL